MILALDWFDLGFFVIPEIFVLLFSVFMTLLGLNNFKKTPSVFDLTLKENPEHCTIFFEVLKTIAINTFKNQQPEKCIHFC